jgi:hypothetical protein
MFANTISLVTSIPPKYRATVTFQIQVDDAGESVDKLGDPDGQTFLGILNQLDAWASSPQPVHIDCIDSDLDSMDALVMPSARRPVYIIEGEASSHVGTVVLQEV